MTDTLDVPMMAADAGVTLHSVRRWILTQQLPATTRPRGREQQVYLVRRSAWEAFKAARLARRNGAESEAMPAPLEPRPSVRSPQHHAYFPTDDPHDRQVQQTALMKRAMQGCRASRERLREEPFLLTYWMAVDGSEREREKVI